MAEAGWKSSTAAEFTHKYCNSPADREPRASAGKYYCAPFCLDPGMGVNPPFQVSKQT